MLKLTIIGHGFVGGAIDYAFQYGVNKTIIDPKFNNNLKDMELDSDVTFICLPTPMGEDGTCDISITEEVLHELGNPFKHKAGIVVIKSTISPDLITSIFEKYPNLQLVYNPEFLTEKNANEDITNPFIQIFGGDRDNTEELERIYKEYSICKPCQNYHMSAVDASFVKYGINSFLATKVLWFNEFYDVVENFGGNFGKIINAIGTDPRITQAHTRVPGFDGKRGFGGACFPKDVSAFAKFSNMEILEYVLNRNNEYRKDYEKDDREKEQNVRFE